jgi:hypothetical protein
MSLKDKIKDFFKSENEFELDKDSKKLLQNVFNVSEKLIEGFNINAKNMADISNANSEAMVKASNINADQIDHFRNNVIKPLVDSNNHLISKVSDYQDYSNIIKRNQNVLIKNDSILINNIKFLSIQIENLSEKLDKIFSKKEPESAKVYNKYNPILDVKCKYCGEVFKSNHRLRKYCPSKHNIKDWCKKSDRAEYVNKLNKNKK